MRALLEHVPRERHDLTLHRTSTAGTLANIQVAAPFLQLPW